MCGHYIFRMRRHTIRRVRTLKVDAPKFAEEYRKNFNQDPLQRNKDWSPSEVCVKCYNEVASPNERKKRILSPMEWFEPEDHPNDCYFCRTAIPVGVNKRKEDSIEYAFDVTSVKRAKLALVSDAGDESGDNDENDAYDDIELADLMSDDNAAIAGAATAAADDDAAPDDDVDEASTLAREPVSGSENIGEDDPMDIAEEVNVGASTSSGAFKAPFDIRPSRWSHASVVSNVSSGSEFQAPRHYSDLQPPKPTRKNIELTQERMNDLVRDMNLTKENAEFLASRFKDFGIGDGK